MLVGIFGVSVWVAGVAMTAVRSWGPADSLALALGLIALTVATLWTTARLSHRVWVCLRQFVLYALSDPATYAQRREEPSSLYQQVHNEISTKLRKVCASLDTDGRVVILAHSLGAHVLSNHIWDAQGPLRSNDAAANNHGEIFDHHFVEYKYADGTRMYSQCRHIKGCFNSVSEHAYGSKGDSDINRSIIMPRQGDAWRFSGKNVSGHQQEQLDLVDTLVKGDIYNEGDYGAMSTLTSILGRYATYSGKTVTMDQALNTKIQLCPELDNLTWDSKAPTKPNDDGLYEAPVPGKSRVV